MRDNKNLIGTFLFCSCMIASLEAKDFGTQGELFFIKEESLSRVLQKQLSSKFSENDKASLLEKIIDSAKPPKLSVVPTEATQNITSYYDPTFTALETITDESGRIILPKGSKINPLKGIQLASGLLFFDGDNPAHIRWARAQKGLFKWILVQGNPLALEEKEKRPVYFDQNGFSIEKFQLQHIPARITQDGLRLKIEEIAIKEQGGIR